MRFPRAEVGLVVVAFAVAAVVAAVLGSPAPDAFFGGVVLSFVLLLLRLLQGSSAHLLRSRRHERAVSSLAPEEVAHRAVEAERARLSVEIDHSVRRSLGAVAALARGAQDASDPRPALVQIQAESRSAMEELRRQLGLLTATPEPATPGPGGEAGTPSGRWRPARRDVVITLAVLVVVAVDQRLPGAQLSLGSWAVSSLMALPLLTRRVAPVRSALAGAAILLLGVGLDMPVADGFSYPVMSGLLMWSVLVLRPSPARIAAALALAASSAGSRWAHEPENGPINVVLLLLVAVVAVVHGALSRARDSSGRRAAAHEDRLEAARRHAVEEDRRALARELHDVASHAVSLVAVQAGAAELAWERDPGVARRGLGTIVETVDGAMASLSRHRWAAPAPTTWEDIRRTVRRLRAAGLPVDLETHGRAPEHLLPTVHRLVQESLTNVLRHAPGSPTTVRVVTDDRTTQVEVIDEGQVAPSVGKGYGLVGLEDRVRTVGGTLTAGPTGDGFRVHALLPHAELPTNAPPDAGSPIGAGAQVASTPEETSA